jgi:hypothetical protein
LNGSDRYLSRGIDYLGALGATLRDLTGFSTLAYELIQNADDSRATEMTFDFREDALVVDNDGVFSDCRSVQLPDCPWREREEYQHRCDFHRFRHIYSGDKRRQAGTTGAFGIGFISVYQITDYPQLVSSGRHWTIREDEVEGERIEVCSGCDMCTGAGLPGTRFVLGWARNPDSPMRQRLGVEAVAADGPERMLDELLRTLPEAMLFLKSIRSVSVLRDGQPVLTVNREDEGSRVEIVESRPGEATTRRAWLVLTGSFGREADSLRQRYRGMIEDSWSSDVVLAIGRESASSGLLFAVLPTQRSSHLPLHIKADFFTSSDRKSVVLEAEYQSEWNRAALAASACALADGVLAVRDFLGHVGFWKVIECVREAARRTGGPEEELPLGLFWEKLCEKLLNSDVVWSSKGAWRIPSETNLLPASLGSKHVSLLEDLRIVLVHPDLSEFRHLLRNGLKVPVLNCMRLAKGLASVDLRQQRLTASEVPEWLGSVERQRLLREVMAAVLAGSKGEAKAAAEHELSTFPIVPDRKQRLCPCNQTYVTDESTATLFEAVLPEVSFSTESDELIRQLCHDFDAREAAACLLAESGLDIASACEAGTMKPGSFVRWFKEKGEVVLEDDALSSQIASLPVYPSSKGYLPLAGLALPGGSFGDELGIATLLDVDALEGCRSFLRKLGVQTLELRDYFLTHLPNALADMRGAPDRLREAARFISDYLREIRDDLELRDVLRAQALVECSDGEFRAGSDVHLDTEENRTLLGDGAPYVQSSEGAGGADADLLMWLGVRCRPLPSRVVERLRETVLGPPEPDAVTSASSVLAYFGSLLNEDVELSTEVAMLREMKWLPARGDTERWYAPTEICSSDRSHLFESQATFLAIAPSTQRECSVFLGLLGVRSDPKPEEVVGHLLHCVDERKNVGRNLYRFLEANAGHEAVEELRGKRCLRHPTKSREYVQPEHVFWNPSRFGERRYQLDPDLRRYSSLMDTLQVKQEPGWSDAVAVMAEIAGEQEVTDDVSNDDGAILDECWRMLSSSLEDPDCRDAAASLGDRPCVLNVLSSLIPPRSALFNDRPDLVSRFNQGIANVLVECDETAKPALQAAGARPFSLAVGRRLEACETVGRGDRLSERIRLRMPQIRRVMQATELSGEGLDVEELEALHCVSASLLEVRYYVEIPDGELSSSATVEKAHLESDTLTLHFVEDGSSVPWRAVAREIAFLIHPADRSRSLAAVLNEVLSAETEEDARTILDEYEYPTVAAPFDSGAPEASSIAALGDSTENEGSGVEEASVADRKPEDHGGEGAGKSAGSRNPEHGDADVPAARPSPRKRSSNEAGESPSTARPAGQSRRRTGTPSSGGSTSKRQGQAGSRPGSGGGKRSRATAGGESAKSRICRASRGGQDDNEAQESVEHRRLVERAGVDVVIRHETGCGRDPDEKPPMHPGFDIASLDSGGNVVRYIEVKSLSGGWVSDCVLVTRTQFENALRLGDMYWLYVVEDARGEDPTLYRIQDPARLVDKVTFGPNWIDEAEGY